MNEIARCGGMPNNTEPFSAEEYATTKMILVVEDDPDIGELLDLALTHETPYLALLVVDGLQALQVVKDIKPDLLLLDYHLPRMNGLELYDYLHATKELEETPAIMLSADLPKKELHQRKLIGLKKPFELDQLLDTIVQALD